MLAFILLVAMVIIFIFQLITTDPSTGSGLITNLFIFVPQLAFTEPWRFITSMFLHSTSDLSHIFYNGYALFLFGSILERKVTQKQFLMLFFIGGIMGSLLYLSTAYIGLSDPLPALGASGAIYAVLGAVAILMPNMTIFFFFVPMKMKHAALIWALISFFGTVGASGSGIGYAAHLGGMVFGVLYAMYIKGQRITPEPESFHPPWAY